MLLCQLSLHSGAPDLVHAGLCADAAATCLVSTCGPALQAAEQQHGISTAKARKWARVTTASTWPEVLRRYLLASRAAHPIADEVLTRSDAEVPYLRDHEVAVRAALVLAEDAWYT